MKIVVTGALGHIGSCLVRDLPTHFPNAEIVMIDDLSNQRFPTLFNLPNTGSYNFHEADVATANLSPLIKGADALIHLAAITDAAGSFEQRARVEKVNFNTTRNVAEACAASGVPMLFPSSTSVYGTQNEVVDESCGPDELKPQSPYAETKLREEELMSEISAKFGLRYLVCRFGTIFGPSVGMRFHTAVNKFCWQAVMGQPITVWQTAYDQKRPYLDLGDCSRAVGHVLSKQLFDGRIYNVLTLNATVREVVDTIRDYVANVEVKFVDSRIMNQLSYEVANARFAATGFTVEGHLTKGIGSTISLLAAAGGRSTPTKA